MKTKLAEVAAYHELQARLIEDTAQYFRERGHSTDVMEYDIIMHKSYALAIREADGDEPTTMMANVNR